MPTPWTKTADLRIETTTYRDHLIQRSYYNEREPFTVMLASGQIVRRRTLPDAKRFVDLVLDRD